MAQIHEWRNRWHLALRQLQAQEQACETALPSASSSLTQARLRRLADASAAQRRAVQALLAPLELGMAASRETYQALRTALPEQHRLFSYAPNLFRDWNWGEVENRGAFDVIQRALSAADFAPRNGFRILVLGSGGGRLAHDLHAHWRPELTLGLEINPYLAFAADRICADEPITLYEFPLAPRTAADVAQPRLLQRPRQDLPAGLEFVIGDALAPPLTAGGFDLVVTAWFSDVCNAPVGALAALINGLLNRDGYWLNHGSVAFHSSDPAACLSLDEFTEQVCARGFEEASRIDCTLPYLQSPSSRHSRIELVNSQCLRKIAAVAQPARSSQATPSWLVNLCEPVPQLSAFVAQAQTTAIHAFIMSLIDGRRSVSEMAAAMAARGMLSHADAQQALHGFFVKMNTEASIHSGL